MAILHTWGQNLIDHPHLHCVVPCGGLSEDGIEWLKPRKSKKKKKFFVHVNIISDLFKKKFLSYLNAAYEKGELTFEGRVAYLKNRDEFDRLKNQLYAKRWVTYCKQPFGGPEQVLEYLANYTHRVAISNNRILKVENGRVFFKWKNYRKGGQLEESSLEVFEFIRRFLLHVLPENFYKIRYYGLWASRNREKLITCQDILEVMTEEREQILAHKSWQDWLFELTGIEPGTCPVCKKGRMLRVAELKPVEQIPP